MLAVLVVARAAPRGDGHIELGLEGGNGLAAERARGGHELGERVRAIDGLRRVGGARVGEGFGNPAGVGGSLVAPVVVAHAALAGEDEGQRIGKTAGLEIGGEVIEKLQRPGAIAPEPLGEERAASPALEPIGGVVQKRDGVGVGGHFLVADGAAEEGGRAIPAEGPAAIVRAEAIHELGEDGREAVDGVGRAGGGAPGVLAGLVVLAADLDADAGDGVIQLGPERMREDRAVSDLEEKERRPGGAGRRRVGKRRAGRGVTRERRRRRRWLTSRGIPCGDCCRGSACGCEVRGAGETWTESGALPAASVRFTRTMRIISGRFRSRKLFSPKDAATTRPIPDRVKESLFSMLRGNCEGAKVIDCFAGTGRGIGLEALSLGAERVVFVERDRKAADLLSRNIELLEVEEETDVVQADALGPAALARCPKPVDLVFFDPPYPLVLDPERCGHVLRQFGRFVDLLSDEGFAVLRTPWPLRHLRVTDKNGLEVPYGDPRNPFDTYGRIRKDLAAAERAGTQGRRPAGVWGGRSSAPRGDAGDGRPGVGA